MNLHLETLLLRIVEDVAEVGVLDGVPRLVEGDEVVEPRDLLGLQVPVLLVHVLARGRVLDRSDVLPDGPLKVVVQVQFGSFGEFAVVGLSCEILFDWAGFLDLLVCFGSAPIRIEINDV